MTDQDRRLRDGCVSIAHRRRETTVWCNMSGECDLCGGENVRCVYLVPPPPWDHMSICQACWDQMAVLWDWPDDETAERLVLDGSRAQHRPNSADVT
jgi:hypothetical protein